MARSPRRSRSRSRSRDKSLRDENEGRRERRKRKSRSSSRERRSIRRSRSRSRDREVRRTPRSRSRSRSPVRRRKSRSNSSDYGNEMVRDFWRVVNRDRTDFKAWTTLLNCVEQLNDIRTARDAFKGFFEHFPFCYGYWRKYAEMERRTENYSRALDVYEKGVEAVGISSDLWLSYAAFLRQHFNETSDDIKKIRKVYQRAIDTCGRDFRSDKLWEEFILWESGNGELRNALVLYDQLLSTSTFLFAQNVERFRHFVISTNPKDILNSKEYDDIRDRLENAMAENPLFDEEKNLTDEGLQHFRQAIINMRAEKIERNQVAAQDRWAFESSIKRPYFHVTALEAAELKIWDQYLDFEMNAHRLPHRSVDILFERCVVSCALYDHFWTKYTNYLLAYDPDDTAKIRETYKRAVVHVPRQANIHLAYSAFEERMGNTTDAIDILYKFDRLNPRFVAIEARLLAIDYRQAKKKNGDYADIILRYEKLVHSSQAPKEICSFYAVRLANFHAKIRNDQKLAEKVLKDAINSDRRNPRLYSALIDLAYSHQPINEEAVLKSLDSALDSDLSSEHRLKFSQFKLDFLEQFGTDMKEFQKHMASHVRLQGKINNQVDGTQLQSGYFPRNGNTSTISVVSSPIPNNIPVMNSSTVITLSDPSARME